MRFGSTISSLPTASTSRLLAEAAAPDARVEALTGLGRIALSRGQLGEAVRLLEEALSTGSRTPVSCRRSPRASGGPMPSAEISTRAARDLRALRRAFRAEGRPGAQPPLRVPARGNAPRDRKRGPGRGARHGCPGDGRAAVRPLRACAALLLPVPGPERRGEVAGQAATAGWRSRRSSRPTTPVFGRIDGAGCTDFGVSRQGELTNILARARLTCL